MTHLVWKEEKLCHHITMMKQIWIFLKVSFLILGAWTESRKINLKLRFWMQLIRFCTNRNNYTIVTMLNKLFCNFPNKLNNFPTTWTRDLNLAPCRNGSDAQDRWQSAKLSVHKNNKLLSDLASGWSASKHGLVYFHGYFVAMLVLTDYQA